MLRAIPNLTIVSPADPIEAKLLAFAMVEHDGPVYIRLAKAGEPTLYPGEYRLKIGTAVQMVEGDDAALISTGVVVGNVLKAAEILRKRGIHARVINMHTLKPLDREMLLQAARETGVIVTVEEHSLFGGLGGAIAEVLLGEAPGIYFKRLGLEDRFCQEYGSQGYLLEQVGLGPESIAAAVEETFSRKRHV
jgi:transketolase